MVQPNKKRKKAGRKAALVVLTDQEQQILESWINAGKTEKRYAERAKIILAAASGKATKTIARAMKTRTARVSKWRKRFAKARMAGLVDTPRKGRKGLYGPETEQRILKQLVQPPPEGYGSWTGSLLAKVLKDVGKDHIWKVLRRRGIHLQRRRSWCVSTDPQFTAKAADIVGLYLDPPENAIVLLALPLGLDKK